jgi:CRISPR-associated protein Cas2
MHIADKYLIVAYDIENNKLRTEIAELLRYYGLVRIQYSVFAGEISVSNLSKLPSELFAMDLGEEDNITIIPLCEKCKISVESIKPLPKSIKHLVI